MEEPRTLHPALAGLDRAALADAIGFGPGLKATDLLNDVLTEVSRQLRDAEHTVPPHLWDTRALSREQVVAMFCARPDLVDVPERLAWQLAGTALNVAKGHGNYRYGMGYRHGYDSGHGDATHGRPRAILDTARNLDDDVAHVDALAALIREIAEESMSAEDWANALYQDGVRVMHVVPAPTGETYVDSIGRADAARDGVDRARLLQVVAPAGPIAADRTGTTAVLQFPHPHARDMARAMLDEAGIPHTASYGGGSPSITVHGVTA